MHSSLAENNAPYDSIIDQIATYVIEKREMSPLAMQTAAYCLMDSIGCGLLALQFPECTKMLGPVVPGATTQNGARVFGTPFELDPITAAFNMGTLIRWLDYNDTWLAAEWGHPSDNFGAILAVTDYLDRNRPNTWTGARRWTIRDVLLAAIQAYEIQGVLALTNSFNRVGLDHVLLVRIASTAVSTAMLGGSHRQICQALSQAWIDGGALRTYRHAPNTGSRKSWAAGDATRRAVQLALWTLRGEMGYTSALSAPRWGFQDVLYGGKPITLSRSLGSYVMENILFKVSFPPNSMRKPPPKRLSNFTRKSAIESIKSRPSVSRHTSLPYELSIRPGRFIIPPIAITAFNTSRQSPSCTANCDRNTTKMTPRKIRGSMLCETRWRWSRPLDTRSIIWIPRNDRSPMPSKSFFPMAHKPNASRSSILWGTAFDGKNPSRNSERSSSKMLRRVGRALEWRRSSSSLKIKVDSKPCRLMNGWECWLNRYKRSSTTSFQVFGGR